MSEEQYYVGKNGQNLGPYGLATLNAKVRQGEFSVEDLYWQDGNSEWLPLSTIVDGPSGARRKGASGGAVLMTTEVISPYPIKDRLGIVGAERVVGINVFKDMAAARDMVGGSSGILEKYFEQGRYEVLAKMKIQTQKMGGDGLIAVAFNSNVISAKESLMVVVTGTGTAVLFDR